MKEYYLEPGEYDTRKSFYKKAVVETTDDGKEIYLSSYGTLVATINTSMEVVTVNGWYSQTTARHINEFLAQYGFPTLNKKQMNNPDLFPMGKLGFITKAPKQKTIKEDKKECKAYDYLYGHTNRL